MGFATRSEKAKTVMIRSASTDMSKVIRSALEKPLGDGGFLVSSRRALVLCYELVSLMCNSALLAGSDLSLLQIYPLESLDGMQEASTLGDTHQPKCNSRGSTLKPTASARSSI